MDVGVLEIVVIVVGGRNVDKHRREIVIVVHGYFHQLFSNALTLYFQVMTFLTVLEFRDGFEVGGLVGPSFENLLFDFASLFTFREPARTPYGGLGFIATCSLSANGKVCVIQINAG